MIQNRRNPGRKKNKGKPKQKNKVVKEIIWSPVKKVIDIITNPKWCWALNVKCKYIELRIDTRDMHCTIRDRHGEYVTLDDLKFQQGSEQNTSTVNDKEANEEEVGKRYSSVNELIESLAGKLCGKKCPVCGCELLKDKEDELWCSSPDCDYGLTDDK